MMRITYQITNHETSATNFGVKNMLYQSPVIQLRLYSSVDAFGLPNIERRKG